MPQELSDNNTLTKKDVAYWIALFIVIIGPYMIHERRISDMSGDIKVIKQQITEINLRLSESRGLGWLESDHDVVQ
jgi:hypothetical protein